jgi:hypothetical protein
MPHDMHLSVSWRGRNPLSDTQFDFESQYRQFSMTLLWARRIRQGRDLASRSNKGRALCARLHDALISLTGVLLLRGGRGDRPRLYAARPIPDLQHRSSVSVLEDEPARVAATCSLVELDTNAYSPLKAASKGLGLPRRRSAPRELRPFPARARRIHLDIGLACYVRRRTQRRGDLGLDGRAPAQRVRAIRA